MELGSNHRGEIAKLSKIASPTVGVITNVGRAHIGHFGSVDEIAKEKTDLLRHLAEGGRGVVNGDDQVLLAALGDVGAEIKRFGMSEGLDCRATDIVTRVTGTTFHVGGAEVRIEAPGLHNVYNALAGIAAAGLLDVSPGEAAGALEGFRPVRVRTFSSLGMTIIDDTYNANPDSVRAALDLLAGYKADRRVFVMGEMMELGRESARLHYEMGRAAASSGIDVLITIGNQTKQAAVGAHAAGMPADRVFCFETRSEARSSLKGILKPGDAVLIKGSRAAALEEICAYLRHEMVEGRA
jgi:UDP-N-acetylmuramoyl-tripeptide--D-alanyl-D-alanine ligase